MLPAFEKKEGVKVNVVTAGSGEVVNRATIEKDQPKADVIVTPSAGILPRGTPEDKILVLEWGADTDRFRPDARGPLPFTRPAGVLAIFAGAFRRWHGAASLVRAIKHLRARGVTGVSAVLIGEGPELAAAQAEAAGVDNVLFTGAVAHEAMPAAGVTGGISHIKIASVDRTIESLTAKFR